jgi:hypothetical protein
MTRIATFLFLLSVSSVAGKQRANVIRIADAPEPRQSVTDSGRFRRSRSMLETTHGWSEVDDRELSRTLRTEETRA